MGRRSPYRPPLTAKEVRSRRLQLFSKQFLRASHTPSTTWAAPRTLMRSGFSTNHIPILRVLSGPTTHSHECPLGARNSISPSPTVTIAKASMNLLFHTVLFSSCSCAASRACWLHFIVTIVSQCGSGRSTLLLCSVRHTYRRGVKVLIIGATGATGQILMDVALAQGYEVTALARNPSAVAPEVPSQGVGRERPRRLLGAGGRSRPRRRALGAGDAQHAAHDPFLGEYAQRHRRDEQAQGAPPGLHNRRWSR